MIHLVCAIATSLFLTFAPGRALGAASLPPPPAAPPKSTTSPSTFAPADARQEAETVSIILAGGDASTRAALATAFRHSLGRAGIAPTISNVARMNPAEVSDPGSPWPGKDPGNAPGRVVVWLDLAVPKLATLYVTDGSNVFTRRLTLAQDFDPVALDLLDVVVSSTVQAVLAGKQLGVPREEFQRSLAQSGSVPVARADSGAQSNETDGPGPASALTERSAPAAPLPAPILASSGAPGDGRSAWSVAAVYGGGLVADAQSFHGPGLAVDFERGPWRVGGDLSGRLPYEPAGPGATLRLTSGAVRLTVTRLFFFTSSLVGSAGIGLGADLTRVRTSANDTGVAPTPSFWALDPEVRPVVGLEARRGKLRAGIVAGLDLDLIAPRYVVEAAAAPNTSNPPPASSSRALWTPWRWRPFAAALVGWFF